MGRHATGRPDATDGTGRRRSSRSRLLAVLAAAAVVAGTALTAAAVVDRGADEPPLTSSRSAQDAEVPGPQQEPTGPSAAASPAPTAEPTADPTPEPTAAQPPEPVADPVTLRIPAIGVESELLHTGLRDDGTLEVPSGADFDSAAWYDGSPAPGALGPSVLLGHIDSAQDGASVFYRLRELEAGDEVVVDRADGSSVTFAVDTLERYAKDDFPTERVYGNTEVPEVRLITCGGAFDRSTGHYEDNVVVYGHVIS